MISLDRTFKHLVKARRWLAITIIFTLRLGVYAFAQTPGQGGGRGGQRQGNGGNDAMVVYRTTMEKDDQKILDEVKTHSELMKNLEYLCTQIGARLTGSPQMQTSERLDSSAFQRLWNRCSSRRHSNSQRLPARNRYGDDREPRATFR